MTCSRRSIRESIVSRVLRSAEHPRRTAFRRRLLLECLESRMVLSGGIVLTPSVGANAGFADEAGNVFVAGGGNRDFNLLKYDGDGCLDTSFGNAGMATTDFNGYVDSANSAAIYPGAKVVLAGSAGRVSGGTDFALARYNSDGTLDKTFGSKGKVQTDLGGGDAADDLVIQGDGKIVAVGISQIVENGNSVSQFTVARYTSTGILDTSFGTGGVVRVRAGQRAAAVTIHRFTDSQGNVQEKVLAAGWGGSNVILARFNEDGSLDSSFGGGVVSTDFGGEDEANAVMTDAVGNVFVGGYVRGGEFAVIKYGSKPTSVPKTSSPTEAASG